MTQRPTQHRTQRPPRNLSTPFRWISLSLILGGAACIEPAPAEWLDRTEMPEQRPSPLAFPAPLPFDTLAADTSATSLFAHTQDLLREAGAVSMLDDILGSMPVTSDSGAAPAQSAPPQPGAPTVDAMSGMDHSMHAASAVPNASASKVLRIPGVELGDGDAPIDEARCARSLRVVDVAGKGRVAVWWSRRSNGRVFLLSAWQLLGEVAPDSTRVWRGPVNVDTLDQGAVDANASERGALGCHRAAPGLAVDAKNGYVHVAYAINAPEGPGVFYAHQMDPRAAYETPKVVMYGDRRMGVARVAASGDFVAVVFEDPNAPLDRGRIGLAVSRTAGHSFEPRLDVSKSGRAVDPYVVLRGRSAVVGWSDVDAGVRETAAFRMRRAVLR
ncbi:MAG: hypothetical protein ACO1Q7_10245 [Gemmatimonas sp.]